MPVNPSPTSAALHGPGTRSLEPAALTQTLHSEIPLTAAMQLDVQRCEEFAIAVHAPLAPNLNLHGTAFAGALATTVIISGWLMVDTALARHGFAAEVVAQTSHCEYRLPVHSGFTAESSLDAEAFARFRKILVRAGRGRIEVTTRILIDGVEAVHHVGTFAAMLKDRCG